MSSPASAHDDVTTQWRHCRRELERAARAAETAAGYERQAAQSSSQGMQQFRERMAALHRRIEQRHRACARLYRLHALRLQRWRADGPPSVRPVFMAAVAEDLGMAGAAIVLFDDRRRELLAASSDARSSAAHDIEATVGQGPAHDVACGIDAVSAEAAELAVRWPEYGRAAVDLGIGSVVAVPLTAGRGRLGTLCGFSEQPLLPEGTVLTANRIADALANDVLLDELRMSVDGVAPDGGLFDGADYLTTVNQAAGMVAAQGMYPIETALALLRARAFTEGVSLAELAHRVLEEGYRL